ncbi:MAG: hypothetical protein ABIQ65_02510, partial [Thermoanaerobaculia bacterium]
MDFYLVSLLLGGAGLTVMALSGFSHHGSDSHSGTTGHADGGSGGHAHVGDGAHGHSLDSGGGQGHVGHAHGHGGHAQVHSGNSGHAHTADHAAPVAGHHGASQALLALMSPRILFSLCLGVGTTGLLLRPSLGGVPLFLAALLGGVVFERALVSPIWNFTLRFASKPAEMLEHAIATEATAVTTFDANGQGIVSLEMDGQVRQ